MFFSKNIILVTLLVLGAAALVFAFNAPLSIPQSPPPRILPPAISEMASATSTIATTSVTTATKTTPLKALCTGKDETNFDCYEAYYHDLVVQQGTKRAFADIKKAYGENSYVRSQCHPLVHIIGQATAQKYDKPLEAYLEGDPFCWSGFYHGVMEALIAKIGRKNIVAKLDTICTDIPGRASYSFDYYNCVHGLGHGLMEVTGDELFEALEMCNGLTGHWEQESCWGGVFMENIIIDGKNHVTKYLKPSDPVYPCNAVDERYKERCYVMQTSYMMKTTGSNFVKIFEICKGVDANYVNTCYESLGRDASGSTTSDNTRTNAICLLGQGSDQQLHCVIGAVKDFISYYHSDVKARELCGTFPDAIKQTCLATADSYYTSFKK